MAGEVFGFDRESYLQVREATLRTNRGPSNERPLADFPTHEAASNSHGLIRVKNTTAATRSRGEILALGAPTSILTPASAFNLMLAPGRFDGVIDGAAIDLATTPDQMMRFCVLLETLPASAEGDALIAGFCVVKVNVTSTVHRYARPTTGDHTQLTSDWWGGAEIMQTVSDTGAQYLYCRLGSLPFRIYRGKTDASHALDATGTVSVWSGIGSAKSDSGANIENVFNPMAAVGSGKFVDVAWVDGGPELIAARC
jgi:hypothetical protein